MTLRPRPVFLCVADPILCLDLESALTGAGYQVLRGAPDQALPDGPVALALVDTEAPEAQVRPLLHGLIDRAIPCLLFTYEVPDATQWLPPGSVEWVTKPLISEDLLARVAAMYRHSGLSEGREWTEAAHAAKSATGWQSGRSSPMPAIAPGAGARRDRPLS
jgi:DNA-binding response OmpR family regulator